MTACQTRRQQSRRLNIRNGHHMSTRNEPDAIGGDVTTQAPEAATAPQTGNGTPETPEALTATNATAGNGIPAAPPTPGRDGIPSYAIVHGECKRWWTGSERSHCGGCHLTFSSLTAFDRHHRGGKCNPPASVGLVARQKPYGVMWATPGPEGGYARLHGSDEAGTGEGR